MPRIAFQVFEKQISAMSVEDKESFPICKYNPNSDMICGIYPSVDEFKKHRNTIEYLTYGYDIAVGNTVTGQIAVPCTTSEQWFWKIWYWKT